MIPASILAKGDRVALDYLLQSTPLGAFFDRPDVRRAIAEDMILEQFKPFVFTALFIDDEALQNTWRAARPEHYTLAQRLAAGELHAFGTLSRTLHQLRLRLRMSAYRKIDAWWCGSEIFVPSECLGAEPYFNLTLPDHPSRPVKIGQTRSFSYTSDPKRDAVALELMQKPELVEPLEKALYPLLPLPSASAPAEWADLQSILEVADGFRAFNRTHKLPVFPKALIVDPQAIPEGFVARFTPQAELWSSLYALGITPILSQPAVHYLQTKSKALDTLMPNRDSLLNFLSRSITFKTAI